MIDVLIVLQTHSKSSANKTERYCNASKIELSKRCVSSLISSIEHSKNNSYQTNYRMIIVDDHSDQEFIDFLTQKIKFAKFPIEIVNLETYGIMPSILKCYQIGKEVGKDLVYFAQDDYLYYETAIWEMLDAYFQFTQLSGMEVCIFPYDDPFRYSLPNYTCKVVLGSKRHWRNAYHTACCFMASHKTIVDNWDLFDKMGNSEYNEYCEDMSINRLFQSIKGLPERKINHLLFTPIPSLALHMGTINFKDPYLNWEELWNKFKPETAQQYTFPEGKILLNLGCGNSTLKDLIFVNDLVDYKEVRVDINPACNPDIISNIEQLPQVENESVDLVYSSHSLEHIYFHKIPQCLSEWYRVIKKGGEVRIIVPNLKIPAQLVAEGKILEKMYDSPGGSVSAIDMFYGHRGQIQKNEFMAHKTGFTKESAEQILHELGYDKFLVTEHDMNLLIRIGK